MINHSRVIKDQLHGSILEMTRNHDLYHKSDIGQKHEYSNWTDDGKIVVMELIENMTRRMLVAQDKELSDLAKKMVWEQLKEQ